MTTTMKRNLPYLEAGVSTERNHLLIDLILLSLVILSYPALNYLAEILLSVIVYFVDTNVIFER